MNRTGILVLGVNGNCIDIAETVELLSARGEPVQMLGFLDDDEEAQGKTVAGYPVLGRTAEARRFPDAAFVCGIGSPRSYRRKPDIIAATGVPPQRWATIVHPTAAVSSRARVGHGTVLLSHCSVGTNVQVGNHVLVLQNSVISHDAKVGDYCAVATGVCLSGVTSIGANCYLGSNSCVRERLRVGDRALVAMGAVVTGDVANDAVVVGNPARPR